jgi:hypothetical protein
MSDALRPLCGVPCRSVDLYGAAWFRTRELERNRAAYAALAEAVDVVGFVQGAALGRCTPEQWARLAVTMGVLRELLAAAGAVVDAQEGLATQ